MLSFPLSRSLFIISLFVSHREEVELLQQTPPHKKGNHTAVARPSDDGVGGGSIATVDERTIKHRSNHRAERAGKGLKVHHLNASLEDIGQHASFLQQRITLVRLRFYYCACSRTMCSMSFNVDYLRLLFFERDGRPDVPSNIQDDDQQLISEVPGMKIV